MSEHLTENLTPEDAERWERLVEGVNALGEEIFGDDDRPATVVIGAQFGEMCNEEREDYPTCLVTANIPVCNAMYALGAMLQYTGAIHREYHGIVTEEVSPESVDSEIVDAAYAEAAEMGLGPEAVTFRKIASTGDLNDEDIAAFIDGTPPSGEDEA